jgi:hypothetical protein
MPPHRKFLLKMETGYGARLMQLRVKGVTIRSPLVEAWASASGQGPGSIEESCMYASVGAVVRLMLSTGAHLHHGSKVGVQQGSGRGWGLWSGQKKVSLPCLIHLDPLLRCVSIFARLSARLGFFLAEVTGPESRHVLFFAEVERKDTSEAFVD